jgi:hypothetical protein
MSQFIRKNQYTRLIFKGLALLIQGNLTDQAMLGPACVGGISFSYEFQGKLHEIRP